MLRYTLEQLERMVQTAEALVPGTSQVIQQAQRRRDLNVSPNGVCHDSTVPQDHSTFVCYLCPIARLLFSQHKFRAPPSGMLGSELVQRFLLVINFQALHALQQLVYLTQPEWSAWHLASL